LTVNPFFLIGLETVGCNVRQRALSCFSSLLSGITLSGKQ